MSRRFFRNGQATSLTAPVDAVSTAITVNSATSLPTQYPYTLILDPDGVLEEVVDVSAAVGNNLTIIRGVDGTTASPHSAGVQVYHGVSARDADEANDHVNKTTNVHGVSGGLVGSSGDQSISGVKTFTGTLATSAGPVVATAGDQTIGGIKTFSNVPAVTGTALVTTTGTQTVTGDKTFSGAETHQGAETHSGPETHSGTETHSGAVRLSNSVHQHAFAEDNANTEVNTTNVFSAGTHPLGVTFVAPPSGKAFVSVSSFFEQAFTDKAAYVGFAVRAGGVIGSGTPALAASSRRSLLASGTVTSGVPVRVEGTRRYPVTGLTAGSTYNAQVEFATDSGGNCTVNSREILVEPVL